MQERQVTIGGQTFPLEEPFLVLATQNPIEQEGTYPLPEAQVDRFMLKVKIGYPSKDEEREIIRRNLHTDQTIAPQAAVRAQDILHARQSVRKVYMDEKIERYILDIVFATRYPAEYKLANLAPLIQYGASPRASINLALASKTLAFLNRRGYVIPEDVRSICHDVMRHRIGLTYEAEAENITQEEIISQILDTIEVP
jgi:MoxR-like ATPase